MPSADDEQLHVASQRVQVLILMRRLGVAELQLLNVEVRCLIQSTLKFE